jgi:hypothetical protein
MLCSKKGMSKANSGKLYDADLAQGVACLKE